MSTSDPILDYLSESSLDDYRAGSTEPWTAQIIADIVEHMECEGPIRVLETGTFEGLTTLRLMRALQRREHGGMVVTVEVDEQRQQLVEELLGVLGGTGHYASYLMDALRYLRGCSGRFHVIFLDDDHAYAHVEAEVEAALPLLKPGGLLLLHDVIGPFGLDKIVQAHGGVILPLKRLHAGGGLGIIQAPTRA